MDGILFAVGIAPGDVSTEVRGDNIVVEVDQVGGQPIVLRGVAGRVDPEIDIMFA